MAYDVTILPTNSEVYLRISADAGILHELANVFTFEIPGAKFHPAYKAKKWDGKIRLFRPFVGTLYAGLKQKLIEYCVDSGLSYSDEFPGSGDVVTPEDVVEFAQSLKLTSDKERIEARPYQLDAVYQAITKGRVLLLSPTASGKSLMLYMLLRWHQQHKRRQLIIVPTTSLVEQLYGDFADYSTDVSWDVREHVARIYSGKEKSNKAAAVISTWQSIYKLPRSFFAEFDVVYGDEAHQFKAKSLTGILEKGDRMSRRIGTTGTLDGTQTHKLVLEGLFGPVYQVTTTKKLMDAKHLAQLKIKAIVLEYTEQERRLISQKKKDVKLEYKDELKFLVNHPRRNTFITRLALKQTGNTLLLFQFIEHGKALHTIIAKKAKNRKVFLVYGATDTETREQVRKITEKENDAIIVASNGTFSTGINIKRLHNIIFASPSKSRIRTLQSIGRGLRTSGDKLTCTLYDLGDDLSWKTRRNYTLTHIVERIKLYNAEHFDYWLGRVSLG